MLIVNRSGNLVGISWLQAMGMDTGARDRARSEKAEIYVFVRLFRR